MKKSDYMEEKEVSWERTSPVPTSPPLDVTSSVRHVATILGPVLAVAFVAVAFVGTTVSSWLGSVAILEASAIHSAYSVHALGASFTIVGVASEMVKLALSTQLSQQIAARTRSQSVTLTIWALCVMYGWLMPVLLLTLVQIGPPTGGAVLAVCAITWAFVQVMSGLVLAVRWSSSSDLTILDHRSASTIRPTPNQPPDPAAKRPTPIDDDTYFHMLCDLAGEPESAIGGIRIGQGREIIGSQRDLAILLGVSKPTVNRLLHRLAKQRRISLETHDGITRIIVASAE